MTFPAPRRRPLVHVAMAAVVLVASVVTYVVYARVTRRLPSRGYTDLGLWLGGVGTFLFLGAVAYAWRKRAGQERLPGRLQTWLRLHVWMSAAGFVAVLLHAGFHFDGHPGTVTMLLLLLTLVSGVVGWVLYLKVPGGVATGVGNLAVRASRARLDTLARELEDEAAGRSDPFAAYVAKALGRPSPGHTPGTVLPEEKAAFARVKVLADERRHAIDRLAQQERLRNRLRSWLWAHVPLAIVFLLAIPWHVYDALELRWSHRVARPADYASPQSCRGCHPQQYEEWLLSSHATSQSSPIMDLQYRAVMAKERRENLGGATPVATLCVTCHAPTGYISSDPTTHEPLEMPVEERSPSSRYGVSCVTCHQIDGVHPGDPRRDPDGLAYVNMGNLSWTQGRTMFGQIGAEDGPDLPSIGNAEHQGAFHPAFGTPELCASCHTVRVEKPPQGERREPARVVLQNTYKEWIDEFVPEERKRGVREGQILHCMSCHSMDLRPAAEVATRLAKARRPLEERRTLILDTLRGLTVAPGRDPRAAAPADGFDLPLPPRRRFLHTFVGVDLHTEDSVPLLSDHGPGRTVENLRLHDERTERTHDLLRIAAGVLIEGPPVGGKLPVRIANLATGHHLPAGFAFAREMWLEVATAPAGTDPDGDRGWKVLVGGTASGGPLPSSQVLDKSDDRIHNLQAVLFDGDAATGPGTGETVLQNEVTAVLKGKTANDRGFKDRENFLAPFETRDKPFQIDLNRGGADGWAPGASGLIRVRLLFRNLPPEFLEKLAQRYEFPGATSEDRRQAARGRAIIKKLQILEVTRDVLEVR